MHKKYDKVDTIINNLRSKIYLFIDRNHSFKEHLDSGLFKYGIAASIPTHRKCFAKPSTCINVLSASCKQNNHNHLNPRLHGGRESKGLYYNTIGVILVERERKDEKRGFHC